MEKIVMPCASCCNRCVSGIVDPTNGHGKVTVRSKKPASSVGPPHCAGPKLACEMIAAGSSLVCAQATVKDHDHMQHATG